MCCGCCADAGLVSTDGALGRRTPLTSSVKNGGSGAGFESRAQSKAGYAYCSSSGTEGPADSGAHGGTGWGAYGMSGCRIRSEGGAKDGCGCCLGWG